ncbi:kinase-like domain-containing protein [Infundibulicybe gibba]|nr:kinase-like domain-containing protein [Infundibulicybe gibba]
MEVFSLDAMPRLEVDPSVTAPFSESFEDFLGNGGDFDDTHDISYYIERFTNIREIDPEWDDDEIDEILVMSPKHPFLQSIGEESESENGLSFSDFDIIDARYSRSYTSETLCRGPGSRRLYALKIVKRGAPHECDSQRAMLEMVHDLSGVPFLPPVHWYFETGEHLYFITDFYHHRNSLHGYIIHHGVLEPQHATIYAAEIVEGLNTLHLAGIIHGELTPKNVMIDQHGRIVLSGFRHPGADHSPAADRVSLGSGLDYRAPEDLLGWAHDFAVDSWGFGVVLYYMFSGETIPSAPFGPSNSTEFRQSILYGALPVDLLGSTDSATKDLLSGCLERNPAVRLDILEIKSHRYFDTINWEEIIEQRAPGLVDAILLAEFTPSPPSQPHIYQTGVWLCTSPLKIFPQSCGDYGDTESSKTCRAKKVKVCYPRLHETQALPAIFRASCSMDEFPLPRASSRLKSISLSDMSLATQDKPTTALAQTEDRTAVFWETIDLEARKDGTVLWNTGCYDLPRPRKLQKRKSGLNVKARFSIFGRAASTPKQSLVSGNTLGTKLHDTPDLLPSGIERIGEGIGFRYTVPAAGISKASICTSPAVGCRDTFRFYKRFTIGRLSLDRILGYRRRAHATEPPLLLPKAAPEDRYPKAAAPSWSMGSPLSPTLNLLSPLTLGGSPTSEAGLLTPATVVFEIPEGVEYKAQDVQEDVGEVGATLRLVSPSMSREADALCLRPSLDDGILWA